ncbi:MAG: zinc-dependent peptidase [Planctomycetes bacterium]|nr:zinc-dependent peptidase [Planctomycetota bacterium]
MITKLLNFIFGYHQSQPEVEIDVSAYLHSHVDYYRKLTTDDRLIFENRCLAFISSTEIIGHETDVCDEDRLLVAASAVIPVWSFKNWHYINIRQVILLATSFNIDMELQQDDSHIRGLVGSGHLNGKMLLSKSALHHGFSNDKDKRNVGIHEFAHLIDMSDGNCDGLPAALNQHIFAAPWFQLIFKKIMEIDNNKSNIDAYGATNNQEFFAVASEYFFERGKMLQRKHPELYTALEDFYQQDTAAIENEIKIRRKDPCPCGSGKKYKNCHEPA